MGLGYGVSCPGRLWQVVGRMRSTHCKVSVALFGTQAGRTKAGIPGLERARSSFS